MTLTLVTSYINYYHTPILNHNFRLLFLKKLVQLEIPLIIFVSPDCVKVIEGFIIAQKCQRHVSIVPLAKSFFQSSYMYLTAMETPDEPLKLPTHRLEPKDTLEYMCYQHSKVEFTSRAATINPYQSTHFAWCDYDLFRHWDCPPILRFIHQYGLPTLCNRPPTEMHLPRSWPVQDQLFLPGCFDKSSYTMNYLCNNICWRFCGGFYLGTKEAVCRLYDLYLDHFPQFLDTYRTMVWDVNFWTYLEQETDWEPYVYKADHNPRLISEFPLFAFGDKYVPYKCLMYRNPIMENFNPSSGSMCMYQDKCILNVRYVNYWYKASGHCQLKDDEKTLTENKMVYLDPVSFEICVPDYLPVRVSRIGLPDPDPDEQFQGIEDIRLYVYQGRLKFSATTVNYSGCACSRMICGDYTIEKDAVYLENARVLHPPVPSYKEKNWIPFHSITEPHKEYFIYSWFPFEMGILDEENVLQITHRYNSVYPINTIVRGSSNVNYCQGEYVALVHMSEEDTLPKRYFHMLIWLDGTTYKPIRTSRIFYFDQYGPEYCLSFHISEDYYIFWISRYDRDPITLYYQHNDHTGISYIPSIANNRANEVSP